MGCTASVAAVPPKSERLQSFHKAPYDSEALASPSSSSNNRAPSLPPDALATELSIKASFNNIAVIASERNQKKGKSASAAAAPEDKMNDSIPSIIVIETVPPSTLHSDAPKPISLGKKTAINSAAVEPLKEEVQRKTTAPSLLLHRETKGKNKTVDKRDGAAEAEVFSSLILPPYQVSIPTPPSRLEVNKIKRNALAASNRIQLISSENSTSSADVSLLLLHQPSVASTSPSIPVQASPLRRLADAQRYSPSVWSPLLAKPSDDSSLALEQLKSGALQDSHDFIALFHLPSIEIRNAATEQPQDSAEEYSMISRPGQSGKMDGSDYSYLNGNSLILAPAEPTAAPSALQAGTRTATAIPAAPAGDAGAYRRGVPCQQPQSVLASRRSSLVAPQPPPTATAIGSVSGDANNRNRTNVKKQASYDLIERYSPDILHYPPQTIEAAAQLPVVPSLHISREIQSSSLFRCPSSDLGAVELTTITKLKPAEGSKPSSALPGAPNKKGNRVSFNLEKTTYVFYSKENSCAEIPLTPPSPPMELSISSSMRPRTKIQKLSAQSQSDDEAFVRMEPLKLKTTTSRIAHGGLPHLQTLNGTV